jgi:Tol biopolymer transport system component
VKRWSTTAVAALFVATVTGIGGGAAPSPPPRGTLVVSSTRDPLLHDEIWSVDVRTGARRNLSRNAAMDRGAAVSPDGRTIAFVSDRAGSEAIWTMDASGGDARRLAAPFGAAATVGSVRWSPTGRELSFVVAPAGEVRIIRRNGILVRRLGRKATWAEWSADGSSIAVGIGGESGSPYVTVYDSRGKPTARIAGSTASWSRRGALAVVGGSSSWIVAANRAPIRLPEAYAAAWRPDGGMLALASYTTLRLLTPTGRMVLQRRGLGGELSWAPDGRSLLVRAAGDRLARLTVGGRLSQVSEALWGTWSEDGALVTAEGGGLYVRDARGRRSLKVVHPAGPCSGMITAEGWSDARRLVITIGRGGRNPADLWVVDPRRGVTRRFVGGGGWDSAPAWSPDGTLLAFEDHGVHTHAGSCSLDFEPTVATVTAAGTARRQVAAAPSVGWEPRWSPDGRRILSYTTSLSEASGFGLVVVDAVTRAEMRLTVGDDGAHSWSSDGETVIFVRGRTQMRRVSAAGGESTVIGRGLAPSASPTEPLVAFIRDGALWTALLDGTGARRVVAVAKHAFAPTWSPDGSRIAVGDASGVAIVTLADGGVDRISRAKAVGFEWSPDGRQIALVAEVGRHSGRPTREVFVASAAGGAARRVTYDLAEIDGVSWRP